VLAAGAGAGVAAAVEVEAPVAGRDAGGGAGGTSDAGAAGRDGGAGDLPTGDVPTGPSVAKFCNRYTRNGANTNITLEVGMPPVRFVAATGACAPLVPTTCPTIQTGMMVPATIIEDGMPPRQAAANLMAGTEYLFIARNNPMAPTELQVGIATFLPGVACSATDPFPPDAGAGDGATMGDGGSMTSDGATTSDAPPADAAGG
jgi:hypothetical protein